MVVVVAVVVVVVVVVVAAAAAAVVAAVAPRSPQLETATVWTIRIFWKCPFNLDIDLVETMRIARENRKASNSDTKSSAANPGADTFRGFMFAELTVADRDKDRKSLDAA